MWILALADNIPEDPHVSWLKMYAPAAASVERRSSPQIGVNNCQLCAMVMRPLACHVIMHSNKTWRENRYARHVNGS